MERVEVVKRDNRIHHFLCDGCGKELGSSVEYDDGYYEQCGSYEQKVYVDGWYEFKANYCKDCAEKKTQEIISAIQAMGFEKRIY